MLTSLTPSGVEHHFPLTYSREYFSDAHLSDALRR